MIEQIDTWLNGNRDYNSGLSLLQHVNASKFLVDVLSTGPDAFNTPKLLKELQKHRAAIFESKQQIADVPSYTVPPWRKIIEDREFIEEVKSFIGDQVVSKMPDSNDLLDDVQYLIEDHLETSGYKPETPAPYRSNHDLEKKLRIDSQIKLLWKEITHLHGQLTVLPDGDQKYEVAKGIRLKDRKIQDLRDHLEYFTREGKWFDELPENQAHTFDPKDPAQLEKEIKNQMANRAKSAAHLKRPLSVAKRKYHQDRYNKFDQQVKYLKSLRNG